MNQPLPQDLLERPALSKAEARQKRKAQRGSPGAPPTPLKAKTPTQAEYIAALRAGEHLFAIGPAGTGKTYIPARVAARALSEGRIDRIIIARVTVSKARHAQGFLPGKLGEKMAPWMVPIFEAIKAEVGSETITRWIQNGLLEVASFEHMRGRTFTGFVWLDEAQNCTLDDLKLFLTRIGEDAQVLVTGDPDQVDIHDSGLETVLDLIEDHDVPMSIVEFDEDDVVRSAIAKAWVRAFRAR